MCKQAEPRMTREAHSSTHPPLPPTTEDSWFSRLRLLRSRRIGPVSFHRLIAEHCSALNALEALPKTANSAGVSGYKMYPESAVLAEVNAAKAAKARLLCFDDPLYPASLAVLSTAPPLLWAIGDLELLARPMIAIVGARNASSLGTRMARSLAADLGAAGYTVVSGLARGVDTAAHLATLKTGTIAVMAGGCDRVYPPENTSLAENIASKGLLLSEAPMGQSPQARHFPKRNRIIAGLSQAVVVVEAAGRSGSLITAREALDLGRDVLAVPGHPFDARAFGCNALIRDGAVLVRNAEDIIAALPPREDLLFTGSLHTGSLYTGSLHLARAPAGQSKAASVQQQPASAPPVEQKQLEQTVAVPTLSDHGDFGPQIDLPPPPPARRSLQETSALHQQILSRLGPSPTASDLLMRELNVPAQTFSPIITELELDGKIDRFPGGLLARNCDKDAPE
jgi:DNA processing protein